MDPRSITGVREGAPRPAESTAVIGMEHYRGKAFDGDGYKTFSAGAPAGCETACRNEAICIAYTFQKQQKACHLYRATGQYFSNNLADSGGKRQEP
jgi:hypothetical protein